MHELDLAYLADIVGPLTLLAAAIAGIAAASGYGAKFALIPLIDHRRRIARLRADVVALVTEHLARPAPVHRHDGHCPGCGRFATIVSDGPRGRWTRCKTHGVMARRTKRIGHHDEPLIRLSVYRGGPIRPELPVVEMVEAIRPTHRLEDGLDILARGIPLQYLRPIAPLSAVRWAA